MALSPGSFVAGLGAADCKAGDNLWKKFQNTREGNMMNLSEHLCMLGENSPAPELMVRMMDRMP